MWIAAVEGSRKMKPENPSFMCGLRGGLGGLELRAGDFFPPDFPVPWSWRPTCPVRTSCNGRARDAGIRSQMRVAG